MDFINIGATPYGEECVQVGSDDYMKYAQIQCNIFQEQLERQFSNPPPRTWFSVKSFPHEFGSYLEVVCHFDDADEASMDWAYNVEGNGPEYWDPIAVAKLYKYSNIKGMEVNAR